MLVTHETPAAHPSITTGERRYIENAIGKSDIAFIPKVSFKNNIADIFNSPRFELELGFFEMLWSIVDKKTLLNLLSVSDITPIRTVCYYSTTQLLQYEYKLSSAFYNVIEISTWYSTKIRNSISLQRERNF